LKIFLYEMPQRLFDISPPLLLPDYYVFPKPGKDGSDLAHYRLILLLSVMYRLLERLILQRIQPLIEAATPVH
jgi:hypothetical protein